MNDLLESENSLDKHKIASLHEYLSSNNTVSNVSLKIFSEMHTRKGIGNTLLSADTDNTLYFYNDHVTYYIFALGGRLISMIAKPAIPMTDSRRSLINKRFLTLDPSSDKHLSEHFNNLIDQSSHSSHNRSMNDIINGKFVVHMRDLKTPLVEIAQTKDERPLVIPLQLIIEASKFSLIPVSVILYAGQYIIVFANDDYTIRVLYVSYLLKDSLFTTR